ncbi:hypothetical protein TNCV_1962011 [Trichonephila clavipes]|nr:hypothetical protein TNCV_1962011 [Trichonephila clavipes]
MGLQFFSRRRQCTMSSHSSYRTASESEDIERNGLAGTISGSQSHPAFQSGPTQQLYNSNEYYPKDDDDRPFSNFHLSRKLNNAETRNVVACWFIQVLKIKFSVFHADYLAIP